MSLFNMVVKPHPISAHLLLAIQWGSKDRKYPLLGRLRYVWLSDDYENIKLLLKDGPNSWSENQEEIEAQARSHEGFVSYEVVTRDNVYVVATIKPDIEGFSEKMKELDEAILKEAPHAPSLTKDPFDIFDDILNSFSKEPDKHPQLLQDSKELFDQILNKVNGDEKEELEKLRAELIEAVDKEEFERAAEIQNYVKERYGKTINLDNNDKN